MYSVDGQARQVYPKSAQRVKGIEPSSVAWKATALPLSYTRVRAAQVAAPARSCQVLFPWHRDLPTPAAATSTLYETNRPLFPARRDRPSPRGSYSCPEGGHG